MADDPINLLNFSSHFTVVEGATGEYTIALAQDPVSGGATILNDLTDVTLTSPAEGQVLTYTGAGWVNAPLPSAVLGVTPVAGTSYTLTAADAGKVILTSNAATVTITLPASLPAGFSCSIVQGGSGQVVLTAGPGASQFNLQGHTRSAGQYARLHLLVVSNAGNAAVYNVSGATAAATSTAPTGPVIYMSTSGNDANNGATTGTAVRTLSRAAQLVSPGHTVAIMGGTYTGLQQFGASGTAANPITIQPAEGATVVFDGAGTPSNSNLLDISGNWVVLKNVTVRNATRTGIVMWETQNNKLVGCTVHTCHVAGIWIGGGTAGASANNTVDGCEVYDCVRQNVGQAMGSGGWAVGLQMSNSDGTLFQNCTVHHCYGEGIGILSSIGGKILNCTVHDTFSMNIYLDNAQEAVVQYNTTYHSYDTAFYRNGQPAHGCVIANEFTDRFLPSDGLTVTFNTIAGSPTQVRYDTFGANTGLTNSTISPNTYYATPEDYWAAQ